MRKLFIVFVLCVILLTACISKPGVGSACIPPLTDFAYYTGQGTPYPDKPVAPSDPWVADITIDVEHPYLLDVRVLSTDIREFWLWDADLLSPDQASSQQQLFVLKTDGTGLKPVLLDKALAGFTFPIEKLFIAPDNSVWVVHRTSKRSQVPILGKYDEAAGKILPVAKLSEMKTYLDYQTTVVMDEKTGVFWFFVPYGYIYSYDPASDTLIQHISIPDMNPSGAAIDPNGNIYIYLPKYGSPLDETHDALFLYSPEKETVKYVAIGLEVNSYSKELFLDHAGRLWTDSFGWREPGGEWYQTVRPPVFILATVDGSGDRNYHWIPPNIRFETPNGMYWFTSYQGGTYSLDFKKGEWCWVSTSSQLEKDADGNLWMLVGKQFYRLTTQNH